MLAVVGGGVIIICLNITDLELEEAGNLETSMDTGRAPIKLNLYPREKKLSDNNCSVLAKATERHWPHLHPGQQRLGREPSGESWRGLFSQSCNRAPGMKQVQQGSKRIIKGLLGGPVVKTLCFQWRGLGPATGWGSKISLPWCAVKKQKTKQNKNKTTTHPI